MRYAIMSVTLVCLVGCIDVKQVPTPSTQPAHYEADKKASQIALERDWKVTKKEVLNDTWDYRRIVLTFNLKEQQTDPRSGIRTDEVRLEVDDSHKFFSEFNALKVGDTTYFLHMSRMGGPERNQATFLAPNTPVTSKYWAEHYSGY